MKTWWKNIFSRKREIEVVENPTLEMLIAFLSEQSGTTDIVIDEATTIEDGLGVTGADGYDLIVAYSKLYNVDVSDFNYSKYFNDEPSMFTRYRKTEPLTVEHLMDGIRSGKLV